MCISILFCSCETSETVMPLGSWWHFWDDQPERSSHFRHCLQLPFLWNYGQISLDSGHQSLFFLVDKNQNLPLAVRFPNCLSKAYIYIKSFFTSFQLVLQRTWAPDTETNQANRRKHLNYLEVGKKMTCGRDRFVAQNLAGLHACCGLNKTCMSKYHACAVRSEVFSRRKSQKSSDMGQ